MSGDWWKPRELVTLIYIVKLVSNFSSAELEKSGDELDGLSICVETGLPFRYDQNTKLGCRPIIYYVECVRNIHIGAPNSRVVSCSKCPKLTAIRCNRQALQARSCGE